MNNIYKKRSQKLFNEIENGQAILISSPSNITYLTGFEFLVPEEREAFVFATSNSINLIYTSFSPVKKYSHINYFKNCFPDQLANHLHFINKLEKLSEIVFNANSLFVSEYKAIKAKLPHLKLRNNKTNVVSNLRMIKEKTEIDKITKACQITSRVMEKIPKILYLGITELETKKLISELFNQHGIKQLAFPIIVAFGKNSALPHHQPNKTPLENNMVVLIDIGAKSLGYCSDMTRTFWFGNKKSKEFLEIESIVKNAYYESLKRLQNRSQQIRAKDIDNAARVLISNQGYREQFIHTTGHSLGLSIHETPSLSWTNQTVIRPNMVVTIEPGIYLKNKFGIRYENTVLITNNDALELTKIQNNL